MSEEIKARTDKYRTSAQPAEWHYGAQFPLDGAPTIESVRRALAAFAEANVPSDAHVQIGGPTVYATWKRAAE